MYRPNCYGAIALLCSASMLIGFASSTTRADQFPPDPVEALRRLLQSPMQFPANEDAEMMKRLESAKIEERFKVQAEAFERSLNRRIDSIKQVGDLRRALLLQQWPTDDVRESDEIGAAEQRARSRLLERFVTEIRRILAESNQTARLAAMQMMADLGSTFLSAEADTGKAAPGKELRRLRTQSSLSERIAPDLAKMVSSGPTREDRQAAANALGQIFPKPQVAVPALVSLYQSQDVSDRRSACGGLVGIARVLAQLSSRGRTGGGPEFERSDVVNFGSALVPVMVRGLSDSDVPVRRLCAEALELVSSALSSQVPQPQETQDVEERKVDRELVDAARKDLTPLMRGLEQQAKGIAGAVNDPDPRVRLLIKRALEEMGTTRERFLRSTPAAAEKLPPPAGRKGVQKDGISTDVVVAGIDTQRDASSDDPLLEALLATLPELSRAMEDPLRQNRLAAIDVIETIGPPAAPAIPALLRALHDPDRFVRWAAARALGKVGPGTPAVEVSALARLLSDEDVDVAKAAAVALQRYGSDAVDALPAATRALRADHWELRIAALQLLDSIGTAAAPAVDALAGLLSDPDLRVRRYAAEVLGKLGSRAKQALPALRATLQDPNLDVRKAASDALLSIETAK